MKALPIPWKLLMRRIRIWIIGDNIYSCGVSLLYLIFSIHTRKLYVYCFLGLLMDSIAKNLLIFNFILFNVQRNKIILRP